MSSFFDCIVVGGGTAGSVLGARLSEDPGTRVLVLEAGGSDGSPAMADPMAWPSLARTPVDWGGDSVPQRGTDDAVHPWVQGKVLGGSSGINGMMFIRGDRDSYDAWERAGAAGWTYEALLPFMRRSETAIGDSRYRGTSGPMLVGPAPDHAPLWEACFAAAVEAGHAANPDSNGASAEGTSWNEMNVVDGRRQSAADAYLRPVLDRPNLTVLTGARALRLVLDGRTCRGVAYTAGGRTRTAFAHREVVLTAGAVGTPHLLMLSGVGPGGHLRRLGIDAAVDLPGVGANLQDHPKSQVAYTAPVPVRPAGYARKPHVLMRSDANAAPDLQVIFFDAPLHGRWVPGAENGFSVVFSLMRPDSRGSVRLTSADPGTPPLVDPAYLTAPADVARMVRGLRLAREIGTASALGAFRDREILPGPSARTDEECAAYVRATVTSYYHPAGTCAIGDGPLSVVGPDLCVHGTAHLRVADASVMPSLVSGNTNAAVLAVAERAASIIRGEPGSPPRARPGTEERQR